MLDLITSQNAKINEKKKVVARQHSVVEEREPGSGSNVEGDGRSDKMALSQSGRDTVSTNVGLKLLFDGDNTEAVFDRLNELDEMLSTYEYTQSVQSAMNLIIACKLALSDDK